MVRIIPRLDIKGPNLVKGIHLEGLRVLGNPEDFAKFYYENGADEIILQDVVASLYERNSLHDIINKTSKNIFIPITVGGGLRNIEDINMVLRAGADKVTLNTAAIRNPDLIKQASKKYGSSTIVIAIEAIKQKNGEYHAFVDNGREETGIEVSYWAKKVEEFGAGEILLTSVDNDGTGEGYDLELINLICEKVNIPVIAHGGASDLNNIQMSINKGVAALCISSALHYSAINNIEVSKNNNLEGNKTFIMSGNNFNKVNTTTIPELKNYLIKEKVICRPINKEV